MVGKILDRKTTLQTEIDDMVGKILEKEKPPVMKKRRERE